MSTELVGVENNNAYILLLSCGNRVSDCHSSSFEEVQLLLEVYIAAYN